jgi:hypothetical protein
LKWKMKYHPQDRNCTHGRRKLVHLVFDFYLEFTQDEIVFMINWLVRYNVRIILEFDFLLHCHFGFFTMIQEKKRKRSSWSQTMKRKQNIK